MILFFINYVLNNIILDLSPSALIEYTFYENGPWFLAPMSLLSLEGYRKIKFGAWKEMIMHPVCQLTFERLLRIGLIIDMFDNVAFPSPEHEKKDWMFINKHGKQAVIPRPVRALRYWDVKSRSYKPVQSHLDGAPQPEQAKKYWQDMLDEFRKDQGVDYINGLLASFKK